jgi:transcriptional regulator with XRE-family HTH domain
MMIFSKKLKEIRKKQGFSQDQLANAIGVHKSHVSRYERGLALPSIEVAQKIAETLDVSIDQLIFEGSEIGKDRELSKLFEKVSLLDEQQKAVVKELLSAFIFKTEVQGKLAS